MKQGSWEAGVDPVKRACMAARGWGSFKQDRGVAVYAAGRKTGVGGNSRGRLPGVR